MPAGKTTLSRGIAQILGVEHVTVLCTDDYHRYNRKQRKELGITPLNPECNYLDIMAQHLRLLRAGEAILSRTTTIHQVTLDRQSISFHIRF